MADGLLDKPCSSWCAAEIGTGAKGFHHPIGSLSKMCYWPENCICSRASGPMCRPTVEGVPHGPNAAKLA